MANPWEPDVRLISHMNGGGNELLDRFAVSELCKGWVVYYDSSEWTNLRSLFTDDAHVWNTENEPLPIDDFIALTEIEKEKGALVTHRDCGHVVELSSKTHRAVSKMKATISHRFKSEDATFDVDSDCRLVFFSIRDLHTWEWKLKFVRVFYDKDKIVPVDGYPTFTTEEEIEMASRPHCCRYLGFMQRRLGYDMAPPRCDKTVWDRVYNVMEDWLINDENDLFLVDDGDEDDGGTER